MKTIRFKRISYWIIITLSLGSVWRSQGHDVDVHYQITQSAFQSSDSLKDFLTDNLGPDHSPFFTAPKLNIITDSVLGTTISLTPMECLALGSYSEDGSVNAGVGGQTINTANGAFTYLDHFYTINFSTSPRSVTPLTDFTEANPGATVTANVADAFTWATSTSVRHPVTGNPNPYNWPAARSFQFESLTASTKAERENYLGAMLLSLGHVLHLNQDMSSPDHVRNDEHSDIGKKAFEPYGNEQFSAHSSWFKLPPYATRGYVNWRQAGFYQLKDFWDRNLYTGNLEDLRDALDSDYYSLTKLGLAEFSNGNFLGEDATYAEDVIANFDSPLHYFPFPRRTDMQVILDTKTYGSSGSYQRAYLCKTGDGVPVLHHSTMNYLTTMIYYSGGMITLNTITKPIIKDDAVLNDYHSILIPKAVEYSAGILDYFFRGSFDFDPIWDEEDGLIGLWVYKTDADNFQGGEFHLFYNDSSGNRLEVPGVDYTDWINNPFLDDFWGFYIIFTPPADAVSFNLVYKGTIGVTGAGTAFDPVDADIAIAAESFKFLRFDVHWTANVNAEVNIYLIDPCGNLIGNNLGLDNYVTCGRATGTWSEVAPYYGRTIFEKNPGDGNYQVWVDYHWGSGPGPVTVTLDTYYGNQVTPISTQTFTLTTPDSGNGDSRPTGITGPATLPSWYVRKLITFQNGALTQY